MRPADLTAESSAELGALQASNYPFVVIDPLRPVPTPSPSSPRPIGRVRNGDRALIDLGHTHRRDYRPDSWSASIDRLADTGALLAAGLPLVPGLVQSQR